ncbi:MAG: MEDS domain-containing protein [Desulfobacca sp.]|nr:MEDS domain-containing protein [Desulfobacca sp.]
MAYLGKLGDFINHHLSGHLCFAYDTPQEHIAVLTPYLLEGLKRQARVIYIADIHPAQEILSYLWRKGVDPERYQAGGQLLILNRYETYIRQESFDPDKMVDFVQSEIKRAISEGYSGLVATGEMTWALRGHPGSERLVEYEMKLDYSILNNKSICLCQYNRHHFDLQLIDEVMAVHPLILLGNRVFDNPYYLSPRLYHIN